MRQYELVAIFPSEEELLRQGKEAVAAELQKQGAAEVKETDMGDRQLAYTIKKRERGRCILYAMNLNIAEGEPCREDFQAQPQPSEVSLRQGRGLKTGGSGMGDLAVAVIVGRLPQETPS